MPKLRVINVPQKGRKKGDVVIGTACGYVAILNVGQTRHKFFLQQLAPNTSPSILTDYASGYRLCNLAPLALARYVSNPYGYKPNTIWRELAQEWLDNIVAERGEAAVLDMLNSVERLNK